MKKSIKILIIIAFVKSCIIEDLIFEDFSDCPEIIRVHFIFDPNPANVAETIDIKEVDRMRLYVFSRDGIFLREYEDTNIADFADIQDFNNNYFIEIKDELPDGLPILLPERYKFVAWGGKDEYYYNTGYQYETSDQLVFEPGVTTIDEVLFRLKVHGNEVTELLPIIFNGEIDTRVQRQNVQRINVPMMQFSNKITVIAKGLISDDEYRLVITDNNCTYDISGSFANERGAVKFDYIADFENGGSGAKTATLNKKRLSADRDVPEIRIFNSAGDLIFPIDEFPGDVNLVRFIESVYHDVNFDVTRNFEIVIDFGEGYPTKTKVTITINGWETVRTQEDDLEIPF